MPIDISEWSLFENALHIYIARRVAEGYVDDLVGEVLLRMTDQSSGFSTAAKPMAWMYRVASNLISDHYRRRAVELRIFASNEMTTLTIKSLMKRKHPLKKNWRCAFYPLSTNCQNSIVKRYNWSILRAYRRQTPPKNLAYQHRQ